MRKDEIDSDLTVLAFDFFYWFSRFEFALKENGFLKSHKEGDDAKPGWDDFVREHQGAYGLSHDAEVLLVRPPKRQVVVDSGRLDWKDVGLGHCRSDLEKVALLVRVVRNNLFHGGKHGGDEWDDPKRTRELISSVKAVLDQLACLGSIEDDYLRAY